MSLSAAAGVLASCRGAGAAGKGTWSRWRLLHQCSQACGPCTPGKALACEKSLPDAHRMLGVMLAEGMSGPGCQIDALMLIHA